MGSYEDIVARGFNIEEILNSYNEKMQDKAADNLFGKVDTQRKKFVSEKNENRNDINPELNANNDDTKGLLE